MVTLVTDKDYHLYEGTNDLQLFNICYKKNAINLREESANVLKKIEGNMSDILVTEKSFEQVMNTVRLIENEQKADGDHAEVMISVLFEQLLLQIDRLIVHTGTSNNVTRAIVYICDHYKDCELLVAHVCEKFEVPSAALNSRILSLTGISANKFINALRINKAKKLLSEGRSITEVAFFVGFNDSNYFSTKFKSATGYTPRDYQR
ncbi:helix-turn-helix domain-containing protein [Vibrio artabrorum]|uniref:Helix-turn-helix domain-containing protein n=2 Tax=Vibrio artabrorum TaxID=446374 RepID=A0ABT8CFT8_9VIBR|nr:helix-turn-helix domain-containing protein [Vibrio artabrorum]MDN3700234.1 helix-turn-helix domain-containing protein [Vibrio artabrorum]